MSLLPGRRPYLLLTAAVALLIAVLAVQAVSLRSAALEAVPLESLDPAAPASNLPTTTQVIATLQDHLRSNPDDTSAYAQLGWAFLLRAREIGDASLYLSAEQAFTETLKRDPGQIDALTGQGSLALSRHRFQEALQWGERAHIIDPYRAQVYGIIGDAQTELGQYAEAAAAIQKMVDTRPDLNSYSRVSYQRELHGDVEGAIALMHQAVSTANPATESALWSQVQLGNLYFNRGDLMKAKEIYQAALLVRSDYVYARAGLGRIYAAQGQYAEAIDAYQGVIDILPLPEFVIALGDLYEITGQLDHAQSQYQLVGAIQQLYASAGVDVDMELALFNVDHDIELQKSLQRARTAYEHRRSIYAADVLGWALYKNGQYVEARRYSELALRLGTRDALLHFHAGLIAAALNDRAAARQNLQQALDLNPYFSIRYAPQARNLLSKLNTDR